MRNYMRWKKKSNDKGKVVLGALAGVAAGLTAGLLAAPRSGKEMRTRISTRASGTFDKFGKTIRRTGEGIVHKSKEH